MVRTTTTTIGNISLLLLFRLCLGYSSTLYAAHNCVEAEFGGVWDSTIKSYYSAAIVNSNFIFGLKERLSNMHKHTKLKKITIKTSQYKTNCKLYTTQLEDLGWKIAKENKYINKDRTEGIVTLAKLAASQ